MTDDDAARRAETFAALHHQDRPLLLPNAWDHASAALLHAHGFPAVGTTSLGVAAAAGLPDGTRATREETLRLAGALGALPCLLSVDAEDGFSDDPGEVGTYAAELRARGAVGINLEDGLGPVDRHVAKIRAVRAAAPGLFVNARTDTYWLGDGEGARERVLAYRDAGADGVFVPGLTDLGVIAGLVRALEGCPLNVLYAPGGPPPDRLAEVGVRRVSLGSLLYRRALGAALDAVAAVREGRDAGEGTVPSYGEVQKLAA
ncbi:isocitrate lyase/PEP mutase family protein [Streptomyces cellulosae]|uniref:Isocitrate lyase/phosphoenolpyruvate mutase family protein n=1 Tax=Streptomyces thermocarboxydus TaxID=59299 RepID=A0ABU3J977_9ACTN|nr:isocitrate lyase/phosphoenolpyruvate mutase family protein [Streptomyces thermocarboxydus]